MPARFLLALLAPGLASAQPFCTSDFYTYRDRPIESYELVCENAAEGVTMRHTARYDAASLFERNGRCSGSHWANVSLKTRAISPFELGDNTDKPSDLPRKLDIFRDDGLPPGELLVNFTWLQGGNVFRLGYDAERGSTPKRPFTPASSRGGDDPVVLKAQGLPFTFWSASLVNGARVEYKGLPVDCELRVYLGDWYGR